MNTQFNIDREFIRWFYEAPYTQLGSNRSKVMRDGYPHSVIERDYWMRCAFKAGAKTLATETTCILGDWATACAGLDPELVTPEEVFDRAQENLIVYYEQLELFK